MRAAVLLCALAGAAVAQVTERPTTTTTPVPILKQVNRVNDDGSYTFGFEAADGSFKLETRKANGEVLGKYGYVDSEGVQQVIEYNASKGAGFSPSSSLIPSPPPGLPLVSTSDFAPGTLVGNIDVALEGYSEDLDEDGFVDPIPADLLKSARPAARPAARAPAPVAAPAPAPAAPARAAPLPASTFRLQSGAPQLLPQPQPQPRPQQFVPQQRQFLPQQQFAAQPQQFAPQPPPQQFVPQTRAQLLPQQAAGPQRFFQPVQGFNARGAVINGFAPIPQQPRRV